MVTKQTVHTADLPANRVAVVGTGSIGTRHLEVLRGIGNMIPIAIPRRPSRIEELKSEGYTTAQNLDDAVRQGANYAIIATNTSKHVGDSLAAIKRGLDILVEKPVAPTAKEAQVLIDAAVLEGRYVFVGCGLRFSESLNTFRSLLVQVGQLHSVRIECQSFLPDWRPERPYQTSYSADSREGGVLLDLIHEVDYAGWLFGWPGVVHGRLSSIGRLGIASDEIAELSWESPNGCLVSVYLDYLTRQPVRLMRAFGSEGTLQWDAIAGKVTLMVAGYPTQEITSTQTRNEIVEAQTVAFIQTNSGEPDQRLATGQDGVKALAVCDAARLSSVARRQERVKYLG